LQRLVALSFARLLVLRLSQPTVTFAPFKTSPLLCAQTGYAGSIERARLTFQHNKKGQNDETTSLALSEKSVDSKVGCRPAIKIKKRTAPIRGVVNV